jgi:hypothetical protein
MCKLLSNLTEVYTYDGVNDKHIEYVEEISNLYQNYRHSFITLASLYNEFGQKDKTKEVLSVMDVTLPVTLLPYTNEELKAEVVKLHEKVIQ